jgi:hypothetical protein
MDGYATIGDYSPPDDSRTATRGANRPRWLIAEAYRGVVRMGSDHRAALRDHAGQCQKEGHIPRPARRSLDVPSTIRDLMGGVLKAATALGVDAGVIPPGSAV